MKFYETVRPKVDEITMCTVTEYNDGVGFTVSLDEYDQQGFLMLVELHNKKIKVPFSSFLKVGTQLPLSVLDPGLEDGQAYLSKKDVKGAQGKACKSRFQLNNRLVNLARRLDRAAGGELDWIGIFQELNRPDHTEHIWTLIQNREWDQLQAAGLGDKWTLCLKEKHPKLFGIKPKSARAECSVWSFAIEGNAVVRDLLIKVRDQWNKPGVAESGASSWWTSEELYEDTERCNLDVKPIAMPKFQLKVTAYDRERCYDVISQIRTSLETSDQLNLVKFQDTIELKAP
jgi:translation initiation factor 2 alpha subunit (eIF-2alpha)